MSIPNDQMNFASDCTPITREQEQAAFLRYQAGDLSGRDEIIQANLRYVIIIAAEYKDTGYISMSEAVSAGVMGMFEAIRRFEPERGIRFYSYATWWVREMIRAELSTWFGPGYRLPRSQFERHNAVQHIVTEAIKNNGHEPTDEAVSEQCELPTRTVTMLRNLQKRPKGFPEFWTDNGLLDEGPAPDEQVMDEEQRSLCEGLLDTVPLERDREIIRAYYGLGEYERDEPMTMAEVARQFGLSRERIRQILDKQLTAMRKKMAHLTPAEVI